MNNLIEPCLEEAIRTISDYPDEDWFIQQYFSMTWNGDEVSDNSIELSRYWQKCKKLISTQKQ